MTSPTVSESSGEIRASVEPSEWSVAIIAAREDVRTLSDVIEGALKAIGGRRSIVDVLVNGNKALSRAVAEWLRSQGGSSGCSARVRVWDIALRDKAHAFNEYVQKLWPEEAKLTFFLDGNIVARPDAFEHLAACLAASSEAIAATAVPTVGRSAASSRQMFQERGGFAGNLNLIPAATIEEFRQRNIKIPLGTYWVDGFTGGILFFRLDPARNGWNSKNVAVCWEATWSQRVRSLFRFADIRDQWNRRRRQARGRFENRALREHMGINRKPPETLPTTAQELVFDWVRQHRREAIWMAIRDPFAIEMLLKINRSRDWSLRNVLPELVVSTEV